MQPQLGLPDRIAGEEHQALVIHVGQLALVGQGGGETLAQQRVEGVQPPGAFHQAGQPGTFQRLERLAGEGGRCGTAASRLVGAVIPPPLSGVDGPVG